MWCGIKGINCPYAGVFGECYRSVCGLPNVEPSKPGTSSSYLVNTTTDKEIERLKNKAKFYYNLSKSYMCDVIYDEELEDENKFVWRIDEEVYQDAEGNIRLRWRDDTLHRKVMEEFVERLKELQEKTK